MSARSPIQRVRAAVRTLKVTVGQLRHTERFVALIVFGGLSLIVGLWLQRLFPAGTRLWLAGLGAVAVGTGLLAVGIWSPIAVSLFE